MVGKYPVVDYSWRSEYGSDMRQAPLTTQVNVWGGQRGNAGPTGWVYGSGNRPPALSNTQSVSKEKKVKPAGPLTKTFTLNTDQADMSSQKWAQTSQHEFGHTMGLAAYYGHPHNDPKGTTLNSEMSYDADRSTGATMLSATINAYKALINKNYGYTGVEKLYAQQKKQAAAYAKLQKLNRKY